ncbi:hypothetical protein ACGFRB_05480 [Streptomyces sp. NPDC048718]|uniref:hypothetical protein n=1 Tax=Streptomyces sp. NPDC048718 TaxID=3365587 RepID=UPI0037181633
MVSTVCGQQTPRTGDTAVRISVRTTGSVAAVAPRQWDALVGPDNFYNSHRRLRALELTHGDTAVVTASGDGRLLGALPTWPGERDAPLFRLPDLFPGPAGSWPDGYLWLGARRSVYNELLCVRGPLRTPTLTALMRGALATARSRGAAGLVLPYPTGRDAAELARTHPRARVLLHDADANLPVPQGGFATHLARMRHGDRTRRRAELRACERAGTVVRRLPLTEEAIPVAADLITQNRARYGGTADPAGCGVPSPRSTVPAHSARPSAASGSGTAGRWPSPSATPTTTGSTPATSASITAKPNLSANTSCSRTMPRSTAPPPVACPSYGWPSRPGGTREVAEHHRSYYALNFPDEETRSAWRLPEDGFRGTGARRFYVVEVARWWLLDIDRRLVDKHDQRIAVPLDALASG